MFWGDTMTYNDATYKASQKYKAKNIKRIPLDVPIARYEAIKAAADVAGESVNGYIKKAIDNRMKSEDSGKD